MVQCREDRARLVAGRRRIDQARKALVLLPPQSNGSVEGPVAYMAPLRRALIDANTGHVNLVVHESDYAALKRGIGHLPPMPQ